MHTPREERSWSQLHKRRPRRAGRRGLKTLLDRKLPPEGAGSLWRPMSAHSPLLRARTKPRVFPFFRLHAGETLLSFLALPSVGRVFCRAQKRDRAWEPAMKRPVFLISQAIRDPSSGNWRNYETRGRTLCGRCLDNGSTRGLFPSFLRSLFAREGGWNCLITRDMRRSSCTSSCTKRSIWRWENIISWKYFQN